MRLYDNNKLVLALLPRLSNVLQISEVAWFWRREEFLSAEP